jgi:hypothetical protein
MKFSGKEEKRGAGWGRILNYLILAAQMFDPIPKAENIIWA